MPENDEKNNEQLNLLSQILPEVITAFRRLDEEGRDKLFRTIATIFGLDTQQPTKSTSDFSGALNTASGPNAPTDRFSKDRPISPKEFLIKKQPRTDVERVVCLAYYLTHYRDQPYFKTLDISLLNTEAAQVKFSNPSKAVENATAYGYLAPAGKGAKQISAPGELFVEALPDRDAAMAAMENARPRRRNKRPKRKAS